MTILLSGVPDEKQSLGFNAYKGKLANLSYVGPSSRYREVTAALSARYGRPCSIGGRGRLNQVSIWCFSTGALVAKRTSFQPGLMTFQYKDVVTQPAYETATEDFLEGGFKQLQQASGSQSAVPLKADTPAPSEVTNQKPSDNPA